MKRAPELYLDIHINAYMKVKSNIRFSTKIYALPVLISSDISDVANKINSIDLH